MCSRKALTCLMLAALWQHGPVAAQTDSRVSGQSDPLAETDNAGLWMIGLLAQADDDSSSGAAASFGYGIGKATWLSGLLTHSSSPAQRADISADAAVVSVDHRFEHVGLRFAFEDWGESGAVESQDFEAAVTFLGERFEVQLGLEQRDIGITFELPIGDRVFARKAPLDADGWSLGLMLRAGDSVRIYYDYQDYDYSRDLTLLPRIERFSRLSSSALTLANSFISEAHALGVDIAIGEKSLSFTWSEDTSAVDATDLASLGAALILPVAPRVDLELSIGVSDGDALNSSTYAGVGILIYGR